jgi:hypothetical protein
VLTLPPGVRVFAEIVDIYRARWLIEECKKH